MASSEIRTVVLYHPTRAREGAERIRARVPGLLVLHAQTPEEAAVHLPGADALITEMRIPPEVLRRGGRLRWIHVMAAGVDGVLAGGSLPPGVLLTRVVGTFGPRIAEYVFAYVLSVLQDVPRVLSQQRERRWESFDPQWLLGKTLVLVGAGSIGGAIARTARAFRMRVLAVVRRPRRLPGIVATYPQDQLREALPHGDVVVASTPLTEKTRGMFGRAEWASMRPGAIFVNVGRGAVVQEETLLPALEEGRPGWAILDVFEEEPLPAHSPLWTHPRVIVTPHLAGPTLLEEALGEFVENLERVRSGKRLRHVVDRRRGY